MKKKDCVFCNFKDKKVVIYNDKFCYAVISKDPINKHHVLVIPKEHYENFIDIPDRLASHIFLTAKKLSLAVRKTCRPDAIHHISDDDVTKRGYNLVNHYKFHIIPRFDNDKVKIEWVRESGLGLEERAKLAKDIKKHLR